MKIEVLGSGCPKCVELEKRTREAVRRKGITAKVEHVYDVNTIIERNVFNTPALVVDGKVLVSGTLPTVEELIKLL
ncbi:MAG: thioredoxin family protein [Candidatus Micrarchaeota archaeon]